MSFPDPQQPAPQRVSAAVSTAGFAQDVVLASSRLLHEQALSERDRKTLEECAQLLRHLASREVIIAPPADRQLASSDMVAVLQKARGGSASGRADLSDAADAIEHLLANDRSPGWLEEVRKLRQTFLAVGELNLAAMRRADRGGEASWTSIVSSSS